MARRVGDIRVVSGTVKNGKVQFNQVVYVQKPHPAGVLLVAIDPEAGLHVWLKPYAVLANETGSGHGGYSEHLGPIDMDNIPDYLGPSVFIPAESIPEVWEELLSAKTNALHKAVSQLFGF